MPAWEDHFNDIAYDDRFALFRAEARDYLDRLERAVPLDGASTVLDFGCGFGFVAELLADAVGHLWLWDAAANMRQVAKRRLEGRERVDVLDLSEPDRLSDVRFDLILINSVVQYMTADEFGAWMGRWHRMLSPGGRVVVSDIIPPESRFAGELGQTLAFALRHGFLLRSLRQALSALARYTKARQSQPLLRMSASALGEEADRAGFHLEVLTSNLTYRQSRITAVFSRPPRPEPGGGSPEP